MSPEVFLVQKQLNIISTCLRTEQQQINYPRCKGQDINTDE